MTAGGSFVHPVEEEMRNNRYVNPWTPERDAQLRAHWASGLSTRRIGDAMGLSKNSIVGRAHRLGLAARENPASIPVAPITEHQREVVQRMWYSAGNAEIMRAAGMGWNRILRVAAELELPPRNAIRAMVARTQAARINTPPMRAAFFSRAPFSRAVEAGPSSLPAANLPGAAPRLPLTQRPVFSSHPCRFPLWGDKERPTHCYCDAPAVALINGRPSRYCVAHYEACYYMPMAEAGMPKPFKWRD